MSGIRDWAERMWTGDLGKTNIHPGQARVQFEEVDESLGFMSAFSNALVLETEEGLVFIDTSSLFHADPLFEGVRAWSSKRVHTGIYTHGHVDHVFGLLHFDAEAREKNWPTTRILAHQSCPDRFDRYALTQGYNGHINARQFNFPKPVFPGRFRYPDETVAKERALEVGGVRIELYHDKGETDDHLWAWIPHRKALYTGDLFIWASPNCGNPQKAQRYPREWAVALRKMQALGAETLFPGHGPPIFGAKRISQALGDAARLLEIMTQQTLDLMNEGATLDDILHSVELPSELLERPYLRPIYDDPRFIVRNLWRLYGGWYDGNPAHLLPSPERELARALAEEAGGSRSLARAARRYAEESKDSLACELIELAWRADPEDPEVAALRTEIYRNRAESETSLMAKGIFQAAARDSDPSTD